MRFREEGDVKTDRGFVEEDFGNGTMKEGEFFGQFSETDERYSRVLV